MYKVAKKRSNLQTLMQRFARYFFVIAVMLLLCFAFLPVAQGQSGAEPCVLSELHLRSQGDTPHIGGSGNIEVDPTFLDNFGVLEPGSLDRLIQSSGLSLKPPAVDVDNNVLMLVIDDFTTPVRQRSHGEYVFEAATAAYHSIYSGHRVVMYPVNYGPEPTLANITAKTREKLSSLNAFNTYNTVVFSMSWVILGCDVNIDVNGIPVTANVKNFYTSLKNKDGDGLLSFIDYIINSNGLGAGDAPAVVDALATFINTTTLDADIVGDFQSLFSGNFMGGVDGPDNLFTGMVVPIAAAGNFSTPGSPPREAFPPAIWPEVIAVSGSIAKNPALMWDYSHNGQLMAPAAWHPTITDEYVSGTSFATPLVSVFLSYMAQNHNCDFRDILSSAKDTNADFLTEINAKC